MERDGSHQGRDMTSAVMSKPSSDSVLELSPSALWKRVQKDPIGCGETEEVWRSRKSLHTGSAAEQALLRSSRSLYCHSLVSQWRHCLGQLTAALHGCGHTGVLPMQSLLDITCREGTARLSPRTVTRAEHVTQSPHQC